MSDTERPSVVAPIANRRAKRLKRWLSVATLLVSAGVIAAAVVALVSPGSKTSHGLTLQGSLTIDQPIGKGTDTYRVTPDGACRGDGGYADLVPGAVVQVSDGTGHILGTSSLDSAGAQVSMGDGTNGCKMTFTVQDLPTADTYVLQVANRNRMVETPAQIKAGVDLTIGQD